MQQRMDLYDYLNVVLQFFGVMAGRDLALPKRGRYQRRWRLPELRIPDGLLKLSPGMRSFLTSTLIDVLLIGGGTLVFMLVWVYLFAL